MALLGYFFVFCFTYIKATQHIYWGNTVFLVTNSSQLKTLLYGNTFPIRLFSCLHHRDATLFFFVFCLLASAKLNTLESQNFYLLSFTAFTSCQHCDTWTSYCACVPSSTPSSVHTQHSRHCNTNTSSTNACSKHLTYTHDFHNVILLR